MPFSGQGAGQAIGDSGQIAKWAYVSRRHSRRSSEYHSVRTRRVRIVLDFDRGKEWPGHARDTGSGKWHNWKARVPPWRHRKTRDRAAVATTVPPGPFRHLLGP